MKVLLIGCGSIGKRHAGTLATVDDVELLAFDPDPARLAELAEIAPGARTSADIEPMWAEGPEVAFVTTPTNLHVPYALEAARRGCHLFIEKPVSDGLEGLGELAAIARERGLVTLVGCNMRFHWAVAKIKDLLDTGAVGRVVSARIETGQYLPDWHPTEDYRAMYSAKRETGGGVLLDSIHELDYAMWFFGRVSAVKSMHGHLSSLEIETEDVAEILLRFESGPIVDVHVDYVQRAYSRSCKVIGEGGTIAWDVACPGVGLYRAETASWESFPEPDGYDLGRMYVDEILYFLEHVRAGSPTMNDVESAHATLEVALMAREGDAG